MRRKQRSFGSSTWGGGVGKCSVLHFLRLLKSPLLSKPFEDYMRIVLDGQKRYLKVVALNLSHIPDNVR